MSFVLNFYTIVELLERCVLMLIDDKFIFLRRTLYFILDAHIINYLFILIRNMFSEIILNIYNNDKFIIILLSSTLILQTLALVLTLINIWIVSYKLVGHIVNYYDYIVRLYICKYKITTTLSELPFYIFFNGYSVYISDLYIYLKFDPKYNVKTLTFNNIYTIEYNGLLIINKITNQTNKYTQILNKIFLPEITDIILRYLFNFDN